MNYNTVDKKDISSKLITVREFSEISGIGLHKCYSLVNISTFPKIRLGTKIFIIKDKIDLWFDENIGNEF